MSQSPDPSREQLALAIDNGEYFRRGRAWSQLLFETPIIERSFALVALLLILAAILFNVFTFSSLFPLNKPVRLTFVNNNSGIEAPKLIRLANRGDPLQLAVSRYIGQQYVLAYENYIYDRELLDQRYRMVYNQSAPAVFQTYRAMYDPNNSKSPLNTLEQRGSRSVLDLRVDVKLDSARNGVSTGTAEMYYIELTQKSGKQSFALRHMSMRFTMLELSVHKPSKSVYQYNPVTQAMEPLKGRVFFRVDAYDPLSTNAG